MGKKITVVGVLADNLNRHIGVGRRFPTNEVLSGKSGVSKSSIARARNKEAALQLDRLDLVAQAFGIEPWQMLVPDLDLQVPPQLGGTGDVSGNFTLDERSLIRTYRALSPAFRKLLIADAEKYFTAEHDHSDTTKSGTR